MLVLLLGLVGDIVLDETAPGLEEPKADWTSIDMDMDIDIDIDMTCFCCYDGFEA